MLTPYGETSEIPAYGPAILRLALGAVFIAHGGQKLFGLWGGGGLTGASGDFSGLGSTPAWLPMALGGVELLGGILLIVGAFTLVAALALALEMAVATWKAHLASGFFINWAQTPGVGHGYEFHVTLLAALICLMFTGPGAFSFDARRASHAAAEAAGRARLRAGKV